MRRGMFWVWLCLGAAPLIAQNQEPKWYSDLAAAYPSAKYLAAVGTGDTRRDAEADASAGLSRQFSVEIHAEALSQKRYLDLTKGDKTTSESSDSLDTKVQAKSDQVFLNLAFSDPYVDRKGTTSVVAYLDRQKTAELYRTRIDGDSVKMGQFLDRAKAADDTLRSFALIDAAKQVGLHAQLLLSQLQIIQPSVAKTLEADVDLDPIDRARDEISKKMTFTVAIAGDTDGTIAGDVKTALSDQSLTASAKGLMSVSGTWKPRLWRTVKRENTSPRLFRPALRTISPLWRWENSEVLTVRREDHVRQHGFHPLGLRVECVGDEGPQGFPALVGQNVPAFGQGGADLDEKTDHGGQNGIHAGEQRQKRFLRLFVVAAGDHQLAIRGIDVFERRLQSRRLRRRQSGLVGGRTVQRVDGGQGVGRGIQHRRLQSRGEDRQGRPDAVRKHREVERGVRQAAYENRRTEAALDNPSVQHLDKMVQLMPPAFGQLCKIDHACHRVSPVPQGHF